MAYGDALPLYSVLSIRQDAQQQISYSIIQEIDLIYIQNAPVGLGQQPWLEYCFALLHGSRSRWAKGQREQRHSQLAGVLQVWTGRLKAILMWDLSNRVHAVCACIVKCLSVLGFA